MPWEERSIMSTRHEFVSLASQAGANVSELARRYGISRKTAYKWMTRFEQAGPARRSRPVRPWRLGCWPCATPIRAGVG